MAQTLGERVLLARKHAGITQQELADEIGVARVAVSNWERDEVYEIRSRHLFAAAETLGVDPTWLRTGKGKPNFQSTGKRTLQGHAKGVDLPEEDIDLILEIYRVISLRLEKKKIDLSTKKLNSFVKIIFEDARDSGDIPHSTIDRTIELISK